MQPLNLCEPRRDATLSSSPLAPRHGSAKKKAWRDHTQCTARASFYIFIFSQLAGCLVQSGHKNCLVKCLQDANNLVSWVLELKKAFDTMGHSILFQKLKFYGVRFQMLARFKSYLTGQKQKTLVDGELCDFCTLTWGIPQGSILGRLLFILYRNGLSPMSTVLKALNVCGWHHFNAYSQRCWYLIITSWNEFWCKQNSDTA